MSKEKINKLSAKDVFDFTANSSKESIEEYMTREHGSVAKIFTDWHHSLDNSSKSKITLSKLGQVITTYNLNHNFSHRFLSIMPEAKEEDVNSLLKSLVAYKENQENNFEGLLQNIQKIREVTSLPVEKSKYTI